MQFLSPSQVVAELKLMPGMYVADLGAGAGYHAREAAKAVGQDGQVVAVDIQPDLLGRLAREARQDNLNITTIAADLERERSTTLKDQTLDAVILSNTLFQIESKLHALSEAFRILKPEGKLLFVEWSGSHRGVGPQDEYVVSIEAARELLTEIGFVPEREVSAGAHHYGLIVGKR